MRGRRRMDEGATPPPGTRPSLSRSHTATSSANGDTSLDIEDGLHDISLTGEEDNEEVLQDIGLGSPVRELVGRRSRVPDHSPSPSLRRPAALALDFGDDDDGGDIGSALSPHKPKPSTTPELGLDQAVSPPSTTQQWTPAPPSPGIRSLTPSPSQQSISAFQSPSRSHSPQLPIGSTSSLSPPHTPRSESRHSYRSPSPSPNRGNEFHSLKPHLPTSIPISTSNEDTSATAFESIPLSTTPPKQATSVPLPSSPSANLSPPSKAGKRRSWNGFGQAKDKAAKRSSWINGAPVVGNGDIYPAAAAKNSISQPDIHEERPEPSGDTEESEEASVPKPRLHAPPAHPHPFPLPPPRPASPLSIANKRASVQPEAPAPSAGPAGGIGAKGLSAFEKIVNHTRPSHLPPKPKEEDDTHYHQWETIMAQAREHEKERRKIQEARRLDKEKKLAAATPKWDALLSDPGFNVGKVKSDQALREMWFHGVPGYLRGKAWGLAIGNPLAMSRDAYKVYLSRARKALDSGRFPDTILEQIERDLDRTLPQLKLFGRSSPMRADLHEFLTAWVVYRSDEGLGYAPYVSHIAAMLLLPSPPAQAFLQLCNLLSRPCLHAFVTETKDEIEAFYRVFENLQADTFPKIYANCSNLGLRLPEGYFRSMLVEQVPFEACCRLWDQIVLDGDGYIFRSALAIFGFLEPRLHFPDKNEILSVLEGRNKATLAITERERERARLKGESFDDELDGKLSVFGLSEDALFDWLATDGWRESRYERLVVREMPD